MQFIPNLLFALLLVVGVGIFVKNIKKISRNIKLGKAIDRKGSFENDGKQLLNDYISPEELWACTSCNACVEVCPVNIDPLSIRLLLQPLARFATL